MAVDGSNAFFRANSTNNILFQVAGGTNVMALTSGGNVGIGTTTPEALLHINKSTAGGEGGYIYIDNAATSTLNSSVGLRFGTSSGASFSGVYTGDISNIVTNASNGASDLTFGTFNGSSSGERLRITSGGLVGIGTTSPDRPLDIYSAATVGIARVRANNVNGAALTIQNDENAQAISIYAAGSTAFSIGGWAGNSVLESGTGIVYSAYNGNHIFQSGVSGRTERMRITSGGNVLIGTTSDTGQKLIVSGNININGLATTTGKTANSYYMPIYLDNNLYYLPLYG
jgi:hypothetical protein